MAPTFFQTQFGYLDYILDALLCFALYFIGFGASFWLPWIFPSLREPEVSISEHD